jgi:hypothetical protein
MREMSNGGMKAYKVADLVLDAYEKGDINAALKSGKDLVGKLNLSTKLRLALHLCMLQIEEHISSEGYNKKESN